LVILSPVGFWGYVQIRTYPAEEEYLTLIMSEDSIRISEERDHFVITPASLDPDAFPVIFYPGGLVAPEAYLYKMGMTAARQETTVYIIKAPFNAAIFNINAAEKIIERYNLDQVWIGGHSLGGIAACRYAAMNQENIFGLFLFGSYCDQTILDFEGPVVSIIGLQDLIINRENYEAAKSQLPPRLPFFEIEDLNHSAFGNYGLQEGDGESNLSDEQVIMIISKVFDKKYQLHLCFHEQVRAARFISEALGGSNCIPEVIIRNGNFKAALFV
jgi:predicted esterase